MRRSYLAACLAILGSCSGGGPAASDSGRRAPDATAAADAIVDALPAADRGALAALADGAPRDRALHDAGVTDAARPDAGQGDAHAAADSAPGCALLEADYAATLERARDCNPWTEMNECTKKVPSNLGCPCETYVNTGRLAELKQLFALTQAWASAGCVACSAAPCRSLVSGECEELPGGTAGRCADQ